MNNINNKNMKVPEGWKRVRLGEVLAKEHLKVGIKNKNIYIPVAVGELGLRDRTEIYGEDKILTENTEKYLIFPYSSVCFGLGSKSLAVDVNDVLYSKFSVSPAYKIFRFDYKKYNPSFFRKYFKFLKESIGDKFLVLSARQGKKIDEEILLNYTISLPPLSEQQKIAEILETVDRAIEKTDKIIEKYKRIKQGLMQDLLTKGIDENGKIRSEKTHKFKTSPLGRIPEEWEVVRLGEVFRLKSGEKRPYNMTDIGIYPVYGGNGIIGYSTEKNFEGKTIIIGRVGEYCGCVYIANIGWVTDNALYVVNKKINYYDQFLYYLLTYFNLNQHSSETGQPLMTQSIINMIIVPLPPLPEQQRIAEILSQIDNTIEKEEAYKQKLERIKKGLMEDLLMGRVRVNKLIKEKEV